MSVVAADKKGVGVLVLVGGGTVSVGAGVDVQAVGVAEVVPIGWAAATLGEMIIPGIKRLAMLIPMNRPIDRCLTSTRILIMLLMAINNVRKWFPIERFIVEENGGSAGTGSLNHS